MTQAEQPDGQAAGWTKFDPSLRAALEAVRADPTVALPVLIALTPCPPPAAPAPVRPGREERLRRAAQREAAFAAEVAGLIAELEAAGARELRPFWINCTLGGRLALPALLTAARRSQVGRIVLDVPRPALTHERDRQEVGR